MYGFDAEGGMIPRPEGTPGAGALMAEWPADMAYVSGGAGLWSTMDDHLAFARLFLGDGAVDGVRLLKSETLAAMMTNQLTSDQRARGEIMGMPIFTAHGFGYGLAVVMDPDGADVTRCKGGVGTVGWPGAYGGWWQADPGNQTIMIFLARNVFDLNQMAAGVGLGVYGAITEFHGLASSLQQATNPSSG